MQAILLFSVVVIATCGLVYELIAGTLASYLLGDSVTQFSTIIGTYLFSMGIGSYASKFISRNLVGMFIQTELLIGLVGGSSAAMLFLLFDHVSSFRVLLYSTVVIIGALVGLEIPLLMRIMEKHFEFKELVARVFTFDYIGALFASLLFPLVLVPHLGLVQTSFLFGMINVGVGIWTLYLLPREVANVNFLKVMGWIILAGLGLGFANAEHIVSTAESSQYPDPVIYAKTSHYQRLVLTRSKDDLRLYLNSNLQFSSRDEYRYHEALVHPAMSLSGARGPVVRHVLVLGGGDGLAIREILRFPQVEHVTLVDLDPAMTQLFKTHPNLVQLNKGSLNSPKVTVINDDAFLWVKSNTEKFDCVIVDFPDPSNYSLSKLYTTTFFRHLIHNLSEDGVAVIQSTSPLVARRSFWCVEQTLKASGFQTLPYHTYVPAFGEWGFIMAARKPLERPTTTLPDARFVNAQTLPTLFEFPPDMDRIAVKTNTLNNHALVKYFEEEWANYAH
ncbi:MAG: polyamine aminopropyltransferase [Candidatus Methylacidiphilales bacterium]|nr:polyamine aminopropyltransferase [Candidatus Methylacidiphilales bacterium]